MSEKEIPYFIQNKDWYYWDKEDWRYKLTDKAPKEATQNYIEFYFEEIWVDENGEVWIIN